MSQTCHKPDGPSAPSIHYFGYGSLVNRETRPVTESAVNATLNGWRRVWNHRVLESAARSGCTSLSVEPADGSIDGVLVRLPESDLPVLDAREFGYDRVLLEPDSFHLPAGHGEGLIYMYRSKEHNRYLADQEHPITQSYIDCVMAGYLRRFGDAGLQRFVQSTRGWEGDVRRDRKQPTYPRSVPVSNRLCAEFDALLMSL